MDTPTLPVTFTLDLENHLSVEHQPRYEGPTRDLLKLWKAKGVRATVFVVGKLARENPRLIQDIADAGHEIGYHSHCHRPLVDESVDRFRDETASDKTYLEDLTGRPVVGYRAPIFSLTRRSLWVVDEIKNLGFSYSSSVLPAPSPLYGFPEAPDSSFQWKNGLIELPSPIGSCLGVTVPYLGGFYLRYLPERTIRNAHRRLRGDTIIPWSYIHPYDIDGNEPFNRMAGTKLWVNLLLWLNRKGTMTKFEKLFLGPEGIGGGEPLMERVKSLEFENLPIFDPDELN